MRLRAIPTLTAVVSLVVLASPVAAHYLWVTLDSKKGEHGTVNVYFEGGPGPGDGKYLDPFVARGTTWVRTVDAPQPKKLDVADTKTKTTRWLSGECPVPGPRSIDSYGKFGVYKYPNAFVLLHYYGRLIDTDNQSDLNKLARAEQLDLDIVPKQDGNKLELTVLWKGKPAAGRVIYVSGPKGFRGANLKADKDGKASLEHSGGRFRFRTSYEIKEDGKDDGKEYSIIRHQCTMITTLAAK